MKLASLPVAVNGLLISCCAMQLDKSSACADKDAAGAKWCSIKRLTR